MLNRIVTGIPGLDEILNGGFIEHNSYLLVGQAGTGKTIFAIQWLLAGRRQGKRGLYIALGELRGKPWQYTGDN